MKVRYLKESRSGLAWWYSYYGVTFPEGKASAYRHFSNTMLALKKNPQIGLSTGVGDVRKIIIPNTPFAIFYQVRQGTIEIVRIRDGRSRPEPGFHEEQAAIRP